MPLQFSFDRLCNDTKIAPANVPDHKTACGRINLLNVHGALVSQQAVNVLSKVAETMDHFGSRWIGNLDLNCCAHRARYGCDERSKLGGPARQTRGSKP